MKQIFPNLQRFHIETIMYLIVIIVALVLLYLFMNNKINLFEDFQVGGNDVIGCFSTNENVGSFNLIYYHDETCHYSKSFIDKIWNVLFIKTSKTNSKQYTKTDCGDSKNEKLKCDNPNKVKLSPKISGSYYDRGYYYIHPYFERWFKNIFIINKLDNNEYNIEFIKLTSTNESFINRLGGGLDNLNTFIEAKKTDNIFDTFYPSSNWKTNIIGGGNDTRELKILINKYVSNIIHKKFNINNTPSIILEDTEHLNSNIKYKSRNGGTFEDPTEFNYVLHDSLSTNGNIIPNSNYNLILYGQNSVLLENIFYTNTWKFINDRHEIVAKLGCTDTVSTKPKYEINIFYCDKCDSSHEIITHIMNNPSIIKGFNKITFINIQKGNCNDSNLYCADNNTIPKSTFNSKFKQNSITIRYINYNEISKLEDVNHKINGQFFKDYTNDKVDFNEKLPYIILFNSEVDKSIESFFWENSDNFEKKIKKFNK
jgi:hypothetical protein